MRIVKRLARGLSETRTNADRSLDTPKERRAVNNDFEAPSLLGGMRASIGSFLLEFGLLENSRNLVSNLPRLIEAAVRQGGIVGSWRSKVPFLVGGVKTIAVPVILFLGLAAMAHALGG